MEASDNTNFTITITRGEIDWIKFDPEFQKLLETKLEATNEFDTYRKFHKTIKQVQEVVEEIANHHEGPYTLTIKVEGNKKKYPKGPRFY
jgi:hypothetical protein